MYIVIVDDSILNIVPSELSDQFVIVKGEDGVSLIDNAKRRFFIEYFKEREIFRSFLK